MPSLLLLFNKIMIIVKIYFILAEVLLHNSIFYNNISLSLVGDILFVYGLHLRDLKRSCFRNSVL